MKKYLIGALSIVSLVLPVTAAQAAPVTVNLRIEGPTSTIFEGPVTTDVRTFTFTGDTVTHSDCPPSGGAVRNNALSTGLEGASIPFTGSYGTFGPSFTNIGGQSVGYNGDTGAFLVEFKNFLGAELGGCSDTIVNGDDVLYGYGAFTAPALKITGPAQLAPGVTGVATVTDGGTGVGVAGATVGARTTAADGTVAVGPFTTPGPQTILKAEKTGAIRSNALKVCVTTGSDGFCGTSLPGTPPPVVTPPDKAGPIITVTNTASYAKGKGPQTLIGTAVDPSGIKDIAFTLVGKNGKRLVKYNADSEKLVKAKKLTMAKFHSIGSSSPWSYLLPKKLGKGTYTLDVRASDLVGNTSRIRTVITVG